MNLNFDILSEIIIEVDEIISINKFFYNTCKSKHVYSHIIDTRDPYMFTDIYNLNW